jgi:hypothetical protein
LIVKGVDMKKVLLITLALMVCASMAFGQHGGIGLYSDLGFTNCNIVDSGSALVPIYAVHVLCTPGGTGSQWRLVTGGGWNCIYTGEIVHMPVVIGATQAGISLGYGGCIACPNLLVTINWFCQGISPACAYLEIIPDLATESDTIEMVGCDFLLKINGVGSKLYANPNETCNLCGLATEETNWGKIKSLY